MAQENLLTLFLKKIGVNDYSELSTVEKETYQEWERVLSKEVRIDDVATFLEGQVRRLQKDLRQWVNDGEERKALTTAARIENYEAIIMFIKEPQERRKSLEQQLLNQVT